MDKPASIALIFITMAVSITYIGVQSGDEIAATLPGGTATGIVAGVCLLLGLFIAAYKTIHSIEHNKLNEEGFKNLLEIHFGSVANGLTQVFNNALLELENDPKSANRTIILINAKRVLDNSRNKLSPFRTHRIPNIPDFLDKHLPPNDLEKNIEHALDILTNVTNIEKKEKLVFQLIQRVQSDLLKTLHSADFKI